MYIPLMESSQLITILILILALLTAGILLLARQLGRRGSDSTATDPEAERVRFDRDQLQAELERTREELSCLLYTSPSPRDLSTSRMPSSA